MVDGEECGANSENKDLGLCATHNRLRRKEEKPPKEKKVYTLKRNTAPIRPVSDKKAIALREKAKAYKVVDKRGAFCETCGKPSTVVALSHSHILPVGQFPQFEALPENILLQCYGSSDSCHDVFENDKYTASKTQRTWPYCVSIMRKLAPQHCEMVLAKIEDEERRINLTQNKLSK